MDDRALVAYQAACDHFVGHVDLQGCVLRDQQRQQFGEVVGVHSAGVKGDGGGDIGVADDRDAVHYDGFAGFGESAVSTALGREIYDDASGLHARDGGCRDQFGGGLAWDGGGGNDDVAF